MSVDFLASDSLDPSDTCPNDQAKTAPGVCGCGNPESDSNNDTLVDCGTPRAFAKTIQSKIISATKTGKGKATILLEGLSGKGLKYVVTITGPKKFKKVITSGKLTVKGSKLPTGKLSAEVFVTQVLKGKITKSKNSTAIKFSA